MKSKRKGCMICRSPFKDEIEQAKRKKISVELIHKKYAILMGYASNYHSFRQLLWTHEKHAPVYSRELEKITMEKLGKETDIHSLVDKLTILANRKVDALDPAEIKLKDVFAGQKVLIQIQKLKIAEDALSQMMAKMFGPKLKVEEGEIVDQPKLAPAPTV